MIHRVAAGTEVELGLCDEGVWYSELDRGKMVRKTTGKKPACEEGPADSTKALVDARTIIRPSCSLRPDMPPSAIGRSASVIATASSALVPASCSASIHAGSGFPSHRAARRSICRSATA